MLTRLVYFDEIEENRGKTNREKQRLFSFCERTEVICLLNGDQTGAGSDRASYPTGIGMRSPFLWEAT